MRKNYRCCLRSGILSTKCTIGKPQFNSTMATGFALLNIEQRLSSSLGPKHRMESTSLSRLLKSMEEKIDLSRYESEDSEVYLFS